MIVRCISNCGTFVEVSLYSEKEVNLSTHLTVGKEYDATVSDSGFSFRLQDDTGRVNWFDTDNFEW